MKKLRLLRTRASMKRKEAGFIRKATLVMGVKPHRRIYPQIISEGKATCLLRTQPLNRQRKAPREKATHAANSTI